MILDAGAVLLRSYENRDRDGLITILGEPALMQLLLDERPLSKAQAEAFIDGHFHDGGHLGYRTVVLKSNDEAIDFSGFRSCRYLDEDDVEFGWVLCKKHHGRGYATALGEQLIRHALESWRLPRILAACNPLNHASERILRDKFQNAVRTAGRASSRLLPTCLVRRAGMALLQSMKSARSRPEARN